MQRIFPTKNRDGSKLNQELFDSSEALSELAVDNLFSSDIGQEMSSGQHVQSFRAFIATWNVGGLAPHSGLKLDDFLEAHNQSDLYVLGFQEIVPLNAGNVLVLEDSEPAIKWLTLINQSLNKPSNAVSRQPENLGGSLFFTKPSLKKISKTFRTESKRRLKSCNCVPELEKKHNRELCFRCQPSHTTENDFSSDEDEDGLNGFDIAVNTNSSGDQMKYSLVASKQMVGIFVTIWMKKELVPFVGHLRTCCISRGIMGCLGNKGCISVSFSFHQTSFCFVCSHLASGEKEGDELRRNIDVIEILKSTHFPKICKKPHSRVPDKIVDHDRVIWLGDLNYRIALSYSETRKLMEASTNRDALLNNDQLKIEREAGRVFKGWKEGKICFLPTYKYSYNSDTYIGEVITSKKKRRTPAWCDRILWHGNGICQLSYIRREFQFSDHRPVCATFFIDVVTLISN